ncbi:MAG: hypothetical protein US42_C0002G0010 [Candidatus Magasanikbacteria bacterium GW2011_GWC2_37_14]|uniref:CxxC-x17-CxxC domain-containing protein n=1 Tax=Candidatus Magasanikbacteria bacterium GW2011_GWC2_37_14 TaxID=1619046 RepID=A0A0G0GPG3_9BACT|nr:MAG: hypothetical protein US42_C0002G0010 [Candidatus Magasanikbacteria bacterium GW2011_GWC2_37_14]
MKNFNRDDRKSSGGFGRKFGGGKSFGGGGRFDRDGDKPARFKAVCSECGDNCELPFRPSGERPVFCSNCFGKQQDNGGGSRPSNFASDRRERPNFGADRQMHDATCAKCGDNCQVPFRPTDKPVYCSNCFKKDENRGSRDNGDVTEQIKQLHVKIDKLMKFLGVVTESKPETKKTKETVVKEVVEKEATKEKKTKTKAAVKKVVAKKKK